MRPLGTLITTAYLPSYNTTDSRIQITRWRVKDYKKCSRYRNDTVGMLLEEIEPISISYIEPTKWVLCEKTTPKLYWKPTMGLEM